MNKVKGNESKRKKKKAQQGGNKDSVVYGEALIGALQGVLDCLFEGQDAACGLGSGEGGGAQGRARLIQLRVLRCRVMG